jgi:hypothetical protein
MEISFHWTYKTSPAWMWRYYPIGCDSEMLCVLGVLKGACGAASGACERRRAKGGAAHLILVQCSVKRVPWWEQHCLSLFRPAPSTAIAFTFSVRTSWTPRPRESPPVRCTTGYRPQTTFHLIIAGRKNFSLDFRRFHPKETTNLYLSEKISNED